MALHQPARRAAYDAVNHRLAERFDPDGDRLRKLLSSLQLAPKRMHLVLSNHYCRFQLVSPQAGIRSDAEFLAWSALRFESDAGLVAGSFAQRLSHTKGDKPAFACAIDQALLHSVEAAIGATSLTVVEPLFVAVFNACRKQLFPQAMLAVVEPGRIVLGKMVRGDWALIASRFVDPSSRSALLDLLKDYEGSESGVAELWLFDPAGLVDPPASGRTRLHAVAASAVKPASIALGLAP